MSNPNWAAVKEAIRSVITDVAVDQITSPGGVHDLYETPKWEAVWENKSQGADFIHPGQSLAVYLAVTSVSTPDPEVIQESHDTGVIATGTPSGITDVFEVFLYRHTMVVNVRAEKLTQDDLEGALGVLERIRGRLNWSQYWSRLIDANVAWKDAGPALERPVRKDQRMWSIASFDLTFEVGVKEINPQPLGWIEKIIHTSHVGSGGTELPAPPNVIDEMLPEE